MKSNRFWVLKLLGWLFLLLVVLVLIVLPVLTSVLITTDYLPSNFLKHLGAIEQIQTFTMRAFVMVWVFFVGGCFASFLNVVAWRIPRGRGILGSSKCPYCNVHLRFQDNLPIIGWLKSGGQCQTCKLPISPRYLFAEITLGLIFLVLTLVQLAGGGINLPFRPIDEYAGFENLLFSPQWDLIQLLLYFLVLLSSLFTFALIEADRLRIPAKIWLFVLALGIGLPLIWPQMQLVSWRSLYALESTNRVDGLLTPIIGGLAGILVASLISQVERVWPTRKKAVKSSTETESANPNSVLKSERQARPFLLGMMMVGVFLGWQAVIVTTVIYLLIDWSLELLEQRRRPNVGGLLALLRIDQNAVLLLAALVQILSWRIQSAIPFWLG